MFLLDTNVVSELRKKHCNREVHHWIVERECDKIYISVVTLYEIRRGICAQAKTNPVFAHELSEWRNSLRHSFSGNVLPVTEEIADEWGRISFSMHNTSADNIIAATAKIHNLVVATRNIKHFRQTGVACVNPWEVKQAHNFPAKLLP